MSSAPPTPSDAARAFAARMGPRSMYDTEAKEARRRYSEDDIRVLPTIRLVVSSQFLEELADRHFADVKADAQKHTTMWLRNRGVGLASLEELDKKAERNLNASKAYMREIVVLMNKMSVARHYGNAQREGVEENKVQLKDEKKEAIDSLQERVNDQQVLRDKADAKREAKRKRRLPIGWEESKESPQPADDGQARMHAQMQAAFVSLQEQQAQIQAQMQAMQANAARSAQEEKHSAPMVTELFSTPTTQAADLLSNLALHQAPVLTEEEYDQLQRDEMANLRDKRHWTRGDFRAQRQRLQDLDDYLAPVQDG